MQYSMFPIYSNLELMSFCYMVDLIFFLWFFLPLLLKENCSYNIGSKGLLPKIVFRGKYFLNTSVREKLGSFLRGKGLFVRHVQM